MPPGVIGPTNPDLVAAFTVVPNPPTAFATAVFDASTSTNKGIACASACSYAWNFGDGTTGTGIRATQIFRTPGVKSVSLTVTDSVGATASSIQAISVSASTPPTPAFTFSPTPVGVNQTIFFNAAASRAATGRTLVSYDWDFGKGLTATGITVSKVFDTPGSFVVTLKVTDDATAFATTTQTVTVTGNNGAGAPTAKLVVSPSTLLTTSTNVNFDASTSTPASAPIVTYNFNWGDGSSTSQSGAIAQHQFAKAGTYVVLLTVTDSEGRQGTVFASVVIG